MAVLPLSLIWTLIVVITDVDRLTAAELFLGFVVMYVSFAILFWKINRKRV